MFIVNVEVLHVLLHVFEEVWSSYVNTGCFDLTTVAILPVLPAGIAAAVDTANRFFYSSMHSNNHVSIQTGISSDWGCNVLARSFVSLMSQVTSSNEHDKEESL